ncbi:MAG: transposase [Ardenticatenales bacterium]|nr:transposase [Ardenticatenales bacterium]
MNGYVKTVLRRATTAHPDEPVWGRMCNRAGLWVAARAEVVALRICRSRGSEVVKEMLGEAFDVVPCTDRYIAHNGVAWSAPCWASRADAAAMNEHRGAPWHGRTLRHRADGILRDWASWHTGDANRATLLARVAPQRSHFEKAPGWAAEHARGLWAQGITRDLVGQSEKLWRVPADESVAPTNNLTEPLLYYAVSLRKLTRRSASLARRFFMERQLTTARSRGLQKRNRFGYVTDSMTAHLAARPVTSRPSVLSDP